MFRFYLALWAAKLMMVFLNIRKRTDTDLPGRVACKICPNFFEIITKPKLIIAVTGTNGKTMTSALINDFLKYIGMSTSFNDWGANTKAGYATNFIRGVSLMNKARVDCSVLEADELTLDDQIAKIGPDYLLVTNIFKDSLKRSSHPESIFDHMENALRKLGDKTTVLLNANDPISSELGEGSRRLYFGMGDTRNKALINNTREYSICPRCGGRVKYDYRHYRHIGKFRCDKCGFRTPNMDYDAEFVDFDNRTMMVNGHEYPLVSDTIYNAFNVLSAVAMLRELGYREGEISAFLSNQKPNDISDTRVENNGLSYYTFEAGTKNASAVSTVFEYIAREPSDKMIVLLTDEGNNEEDAVPAVDKLLNIYERDYSALNDPKIKKIAVTGNMAKELKMRLTLAGIPNERILVLRDRADIQKYAGQMIIDKVFFINDADPAAGTKDILESIVS